MSSHSPALEIDGLYAEKLAACLAKAEGNGTADEADFCRRYPDYEHTRHLDALRAAQYQRLDALKHVYLDYTGGGLYASSQVEQHHRLLAADVYGNPHSFNPTSLAATHLVEKTRETIHEYFHADPDEYRIIFTANASGALKLVGESYPFENRGQYMLTFDNHNSVNGIREFARLHGANVNYVPITLPDLRMDAAALREMLAQAIPGGNNLFAYPAQSNFSGVQHDLTWVVEARERGWDVLLDCAAYLPTNRFDLRECKPDFATLSFYKMFGYPTGIGALIVRRDKLKKLRRPWFAGGTVEIVSTLAPVFVRAEDEAAFEDGTVNYLSIPAVEIGLRHLLECGMDAIHSRVVALTGYLLDNMTVLRHSNGSPLVQIYGPTTSEGRGGTIAFNLLDERGEMFDVRLVEALANQAHISLRTGCFCNPGAGENAFHLTRQNVEECSVAAAPVTYERYVAALSATTGHTVTGAIRVSVGIVSNYADVSYFVRFLRSFLDLESPGLLD
jgi:selenocysteine lyase/cysteine desulfurase